MPCWRMPTRCGRSGSEVSGDGGNEPVVLVYEVKCRVVVDTAEVDRE
jgi:hypothetical protein